MTGITLTGKAGTVSFAPRARLMKLIGGELVSDEVVAVTELVKNAYDAGARNVRLEFIDVESGDGQIVISDDGCGMSLQDVADYWMQPGGTSKSGARQRKSRGGRRVLGEKGIGRFAVDKLGSQPHPKAGIFPLSRYGACRIRSDPLTSGRGRCFGFPSI